MQDHRYKEPSNINCRHGVPVGLEFVFCGLCLATVGPATKLPTGSKLRKDIPLARGLLDYFPNALAAVAELSRIGNDKHNPGQPLHWSKGKSNDHADCIIRHLIERGTVDPDDNVLHSVKVAWRALALLQIELETAAKTG